MSASNGLGTPGPENLSSPVLRNSKLGAFLLDATTGSSSAPNRFRIIDVSVFPSANTPGFADLRAITSSDIVISNIMDNATYGAVQTPPATPPTAPAL